MISLFRSEVVRGGGRGGGGLVFGRYKELRCSMTFEGYMEMG